jgi:hypothetical protein
VSVDDSAVDVDANDAAVDADIIGVEAVDENGVELECFSIKILPIDFLTDSNLTLSAE